MDKMILTAGPSITEREIGYVTDAITNGHGEHWGDYIKWFESSFARYIGVKHALATSSCTGALHLALTALGIGKGDEVIVPDTSWVATASAVAYTGATPVFADVLSDSWCIDPDSIESLINWNTKAIMPVHLYGQLCEMGKIKNIAEAHNLFIIEDAAPSVGTEFFWKKTGSFGDVGCFSFQGAKILSTGEGGMLVTNNTELFNKVKHYAEHGRSGAGFDISKIGFKYKMSNLQAAMGLGQLERVDELVAKKREIYSWYRECLNDIGGIGLNKQMTNTEKPNYWMTSVVLLEDFGIPRDEVMVQLKKRCVDSRPFFPQISSFPMFDYYDNPVAKYIGANGINLPSAHNLVHEDVKYVCECLKDILVG
jgi:perosamine synthetase